MRLKILEKQRDMLYTILSISAITFLVRSLYYIREDRAIFEFILGTIFFILMFQSQKFFYKEIEKEKRRILYQQRKKHFQRKLKLRK